MNSVSLVCLSACLTFTIIFQYKLLVILAHTTSLVTVVLLGEVNCVVALHSLLNTSIARTSII
jgi:hypothetical protein